MILSILDFFPSWQGQIDYRGFSCFNSVSMDPPLVLWSIADDAMSYDTFMNAKYFAVNLLTSGQQELSARFASKGADKFEGLEYKVVKNTLVKIAVEEQEYAENLSEHLSDPTAVVWSYEDPVAPAKVVMNFAKNNDKLTVKASYGSLPFNVDDIAKIVFEGSGSNVDAIRLKVGDNISGVVIDEKITVKLVSGTLIVLSKDKVKEILVSDYEAMFWKNLRCPPDGLEEVSVFENFLNWIKVFQTRHSPVNDIENEMVRKMAAMQAKIFPLKSRVSPGRDGPVEGDRFLLTLRHGSHGIRALLRYFCQGHSFLKAAIGKPPQNQSELLSLQSLIQSIKNGFNSESPRTQQSILKFLAHLKSVFCVKQDLSTPVRNGCRSLIRFVGPRTVDMIQKLCDEIQ